MNGDNPFVILREVCKKIQIFKLPDLSIFYLHTCELADFEEFFSVHKIVPSDPARRMCVGQLLRMIFDFTVFRVIKTQFPNYSDIFLFSLKRIQTAYPVGYFYDRYTVALGKTQMYPYRINKNLWQVKL